MKKKTLILFFLFFSQLIRAQEKPLSIEGTFTCDYVQNLAGGIKLGNRSLGLFELGLDWQPKKGFLRNSEFYLHILKSTGGYPSADIIGDLQTISNIEGHVNHMVYEMWFKQELGDVNLLIGFHDVNSEFFFAESTTDYVNSSFGISPGLSVNQPVSLYPITTLGMVVNLEKGNLGFSSAFYNLNHDFPESKNFKIKEHVFSGGYLTIGEIRYGNVLNKGVIKLGFYAKQCRMKHKINGGGCVRNFNYGNYFLAEKSLVKFNSGQRINGFFQWSTHPSSINLIASYVGGGIVLINEIPDSSFGLGVASAKIGEMDAYNTYIPNKSETTFELFYRRLWMNTVVFQPDVQYVRNVGGTNSNCFVFLFRFKINFIYQAEWPF